MSYPRMIGLLTAFCFTAPSLWPTEVDAADVEEQRIPNARAKHPDMVTRYERHAGELAEGLGVAGNARERSALVARTALELWRHAVADGKSGYADDRALYWGRLLLRSTVRRALTQTAELDGLLELLEHHSRGFSSVRFPDDGTLRILITGFDPFQLDSDVAQSNPSGLAALMLDGATLSAGATRATVAAAMMPVRFEDFDRGIVEDFFTPHFHNANLALVATISMGRSGFDLERFPGLRRSATGTDNANVLTGASAQNPLVPYLRGDLLVGPEFIEFSLPVDAMLSAAGNWPVRDNREVTTLERGRFDAVSLAELEGQTAVRGSGGGYLSNEISYRSKLLHHRLRVDFPIGHIHTPRVTGYNEPIERQIVAQIRQLLTFAVAGSAKPPGPEPRRQ